MPFANYLCGAFIGVFRPDNNNVALAADTEGGDCAIMMMMMMIMNTRWSKMTQILTDFPTYFTFRIRKTFVIIVSLTIPPHLTSVATLPCEMSVSYD